MVWPLTFGCKLWFFFFKKNPVWQTVVWPLGLQKLGLSDRGVANGVAKFRMASGRCIYWNRVGIVPIQRWPVLERNWYSPRTGKYIEDARQVISFYALGTRYCPSGHGPVPDSFEFPRKKWKITAVSDVPRIRPRGFLITPFVGRDKIDSSGHNTCFRLAPVIIKSLLKVDDNESHNAPLSSGATSLRWSLVSWLGLMTSSLQQ